MLAWRILIAQAIFLIAPTELAPIPKLAPPAPNAPPQAYPIAWRTCAPTLAPQILNAPPPHLTATAAFAALLSPAQPIPTAPAQSLIATAALVALLSSAHLLHNARVLCPIATVAYAIP